ncbi:MAG: ribosome-binding factor A [Sneathiella sp.]|jgi:ribosome-binding factor A|uniref:30S ribosome-binding factor RbfA n=1 Tax=Sneathiella sp. TaxID=1964365 RepID=UPI000C4830E4|nr:30S ribosome-binding factor RbfA [Sneathiella sp.]MAL79087.1 ribosome-binding factor A [Sneathiella sp.]|tara:strand:+ start:650 stop:1039 length:390 start_codon:yes stop_codon:yes gene_type:complete
MAQTKRGAKPASKRQLRVGEELRHILSEILSRDIIHNPDVAGASVTISEVKASPDMRNATVFVTTLGGINEDAAIAGLNRAAGVIQAEMGRHLTMKFTPKLIFKRDDSFDYGSHIDELIRKSRRPEEPN